jgi:UDP-N-acetylglucosamine diphosphorylase/glucosamine-1-phosphate N-acetyltransferase
MNYILFDDHSWENLLPLTFTRPVSEITAGILKLREKWELMTSLSFSHLSRKYLSEKFPLKIEDDNLLINSAIIPDKEIVEEIFRLNKSEALYRNNRMLACRIGSKELSNFNYNEGYSGTKINASAECTLIDFPWQIFQLSGNNITFDFELVTKGRKSLKLSDTNNLIAPENIFVEEGVRAEFVTINASTGPVYLAKKSEIMEGSLIRGPFSLGEESTVKMAAKIYGPTTIGPFSKVGGEINNSIILGYSNKAHDGFLGNSVIGEWCNIGADSNNSNLKNNYAEVKVWNYPAEKFIKTGAQFCGLIMGDHSKCGINTMFNTGTVIGVNTNIFGSGFPRNFIPSFSWGGAHGFSVFNISKAYEVADIVMSRRNIPFGEVDKKILAEIFRMTEKYRKNA